MAELQRELIDREAQLKASEDMCSQLYQALNQVQVVKATEFAQMKASYQEALEVW